MAASPPMEGRRVTVTLLDVPLDLRLTVAEEVCARSGWEYEDQVAMMLAANQPDPRKYEPLVVDAEKAALVAAGKRPPGATPPVWEW